MKTKKILSLFLSILMLLSIMLTVHAQDAEADTIVLYTNDVHCAIDDYSVFAAYRAQLINEGYTVITIDAGDAIQGNIIGTMSDGDAPVDIMNTVGYDYAVPGNHEYDYGMDVLLSIAENKAEYKYMSSNFIDLTTDSTVFEPYYIEEVNGESIAFVGITTPESITKSTPAYFQNENGEYIYDFSAENLYEVVQNNVDAATAEGADRVVVIGHLGIDGTTDGWKSTDVIANTTGIDVFIDAHSHEVIEQDTYKNKDNEDVILSSTGTKFAYFGQLTLDADGSEETKLIDPDTVEIEALSASAKTAYNSVKNKIYAYNAEVSYLYDDIGTSEVELVAYDENGDWLVRHAETNMGNFVTDAYMYGIDEADIVLVNSGGIRAEIGIGSVARINFMNINPWNNEMCVIKVTGQQIVNALEHGARKYPENSGGFLQTSSSLTYEIDAWKESPVIIDDKGNFAGIDETKERRVSNVLYNGSPIELDKEYSVAGTLYMLTQGGDGFTMFKDASDVKTVDYVDSELLINYFTEGLGGCITAEMYGDPAGDGRITINEEPSDTDTDNTSDICDYCDKVHSGFIQKLFCMITQFFVTLFTAIGIW